MNELDQDVGDGRQYLTFVSAGQTFGIPIMRMKEIVPFQGCTRVPLAPGPIAGLINLRGRAIPVLDLAIRFGSQGTPVTRRSCVLIVDRADQGLPEMGIVADSVSRVMDVAERELEQAPSFGTGVSAAYLTAMVRSENDFIPILDIDRVLDINTGDLDLVAAAPEAARRGAADATTDPSPDAG